jgi:hypothetical protein
VNHDGTGANRSGHQELAQDEVSLPEYRDNSELRQKMGKETDRVSLLWCLRDGYFSCPLNMEAHQASEDNLVLGRALVILLAAGLSGCAHFIIG